MNLLINETIWFLIKKVFTINIYALIFVFSWNRIEIIFLMVLKYYHICSYIFKLYDIFSELFIFEYYRFFLLV